MAAGQADVQIIVELINKTKEGINQTIKDIKTKSMDAATGVKNLDKQFSTLDKTQRVLDRSMGKTKQQFAGWALSIMFFGMALRRTFDQIWKESSKTFQDVMHSTEGTVTGFDMLTGSLDYLKFTAGQALEPLAMFFVPIIDAVADWITTNEKLFASIVALVGFLGTAFVVGGGLKLAKDGFTTLSELSFGGLSGLAGFLSTPVGAGVLAALAALTALGAVSWKAFKETPEAWESIKNSLKQIEKPFKSLMDSLEDMIQSILPEFNLNWEDIAWTIAWTADLFFKAIENMIRGGLMLIDTLKILVNTFALLFKLVATKNYGMAAINILNITDAVSDMKKQLSSLNTIWDADVFTDPMQFKQYELNRQRLESNKEAESLPTSSMYSPEAVQWQLFIDGEQITDLVARKINSSTG